MRFQRAMRGGGGWKFETPHVVSYSRTIPRPPTCALHALYMPFAWDGVASYMHGTCGGHAWGLRGESLGNAC